MNVVGPPLVTTPTYHNSRNIGKNIRTFKVDYIKISFSDRLVGMNVKIS